MFYCDKCAERANWPKTYFRSHGRCEICGNTASCSDMPSRMLPDPTPEKKGNEHDNS